MPIWNIRLEETLVHRFAIEAGSHDEALAIAGEVRDDETADDCEACTIDAWPHDGKAPVCVFVDVKAWRDRERLRDSAPALLAALETALDICPPGMLDTVWAQEARAAIAKARGK